jgi:hypothetical protein
MKAKVLKSFYPPSNNKVGGVEIQSITGGLIREGQIIDVDASIGGPLTDVYYKTKKLIVGTDVELISDGPQPIEVNKQQKGSLLFYGGLLALTYIVYKIVTKNNE